MTILIFLWGIPVIIVLYLEESLVMALAFLGVFVAYFMALAHSLFNKLTDQKRELAFLERDGRERPEDDQDHK